MAIQQILALVVASSQEQETPRGQPGIVDGISIGPMPAASSTSSANVLLTLKLTPVDPKTDKPSLLASLGVSLGVWVLIAQLAF